MKLGFIGAGNMAGAILLGGAHGANVYDVNAETMRRREQECGAVPFSSAEALIRASDVILLAVKPNVAPGVLRENRAAFAGKAVISIVAGLTVATLKALLPAEARFLRVMPNTPLLVSEGATAVTRGAHATDEDLAYAKELFACLGLACVVDEADMDAIGAVSGSGPAYVAALIEALRDGGVAEGLDAELAEKLALQTVLGTARLMTETGRGAEETRIAVCSPGGTTLAALAAMEEGGFTESLKAGVAAAVVRSKELARC